MQAKEAKASAEAVEALKKAAKAAGVEGGYTALPRTGQAEIESWQLGQMVTQALPVILAASHGQLHFAAQPGGGNAGVAAAVGLVLGVLHELRPQLPGGQDGLQSVEAALALCYGLLEVVPALAQLIQGLHSQQDCKGGLQPKHAKHASSCTGAAMCCAHASASAPC